MTYSLIWLPEALEHAGLKVAKVPKWQTRGHGNFGKARGVLCHHTVGSPKGNMPSLNVITHGRPGLSGPLANLGLGRDGTWYIVAAGLAYHAGRGNYRGVTSGNSQLIGIEAENNGTTEPWGEAQMESFQHGCAALLKHIGVGPEMCAGHKEYALPPGRKIDPSFSMPAFRLAVAQIMTGSGPAPPVIPSVDDEDRLTLRRGARGEDVKTVQRAVGVPADGKFGANTEAAVRVFQRANGLVPDGIVGPKSWSAIDEARKDEIS